MNNPHSLFQQVSAIVQSNNKVLDATGGRFNIFRIIGMTSEETRLHSAFLAELLNVKGSHGLKDKPLKAFISKFLDADFEFESSDSECNVEYFIGRLTDTTGGRIDIIIRDKHKRSVIIENKIYAADQGSQMLRYYNYSKEFLSSRLIYLSLDGKEPSDYSTGGNSFTFMTLSYKYNIIKWLEECRQIAVDLPLVREAISHYINLLKHLTNSSLMEEANNEIADLIMQSPENIQVALEIDSVLTIVKIRTQMKFWDQLRASIEDKGLEVNTKHPQTVNENKVRSYYVDSRNKALNYGLWVEVIHENGIIIEWGCVVQQNVYFGFTIKYESGKKLTGEDIKEYKLIIQQCDNSFYLDYDNWLGWMYPTKLLNFRAFNSEDIFSLLKHESLVAVTDEIAAKALNDIRFIRENVQQYIAKLVI